jgi:hypothetical protein
MFSLLFGMMLAVNVGPISPDAPAREPQLAVNGSMVALTFGAGKAIYFSQSEDAGKTFSAPVKVAEAAIVPLTRHRGPRIAFTRNGIVISAVIGTTPAGGAHTHGLPSDGDLLAWRSLDGGKTWSKGVAVNDVPGAATEGLHSLAADSKGNLFAAWLDKRSGRGTRLYGARSADGGSTWSRNILIYESPDGTICECCHPSVAIDSAGQILVMWRNWLSGARDMYLARSQDAVNFSKPERLGKGTWKLNACPMDGGGLAVSQNRIVTAWRRERQIFLASPGEQEVEIAEGLDVAIADGRSGIYAIWSTPAGIRALTPGKKEPSALAAKGSFPNIAALLNGGALAAWEDEGTIVIRQIP